MLVDAGADQPVGGLRRQQHVVDADAVVLLPGAGLIVPEGVEAGSSVERAHGIGQAEMGQRAEVLARLRQEQRVVDPGGRVRSVGRRDDVVIARQDQWLLQLKRSLV